MKQLTLILAVLLTAGCGGTIDLSCDKPRLYQQARENDRIEVPQGMSNLDPSMEMPVPDASPRPPREKGEPCLDIPPRYLKEGDVVKPAGV